MITKNQGLSGLLITGISYNYWKSIIDAKYDKNLQVLIVFYVMVERMKWLSLKLMSLDILLP